MLSPLFKLYCPEQARLNLRSTGTTLAFFTGLMLLSVLFLPVSHAQDQANETQAESAPSSDAEDTMSGRKVEEAGVELSGSTQKPRWEVGLAAGYSRGYDYPASSDNNNRAVAVPFFIYRTPRLRFGDGGIKAVAIERPRLKLDLSIGGSLNSSSQGNSVRVDMPDLDFLFELGPQLQFQLFDRRLASGSRLRGRLASEARAVFSTDFGSVDARGFVADIGFGVGLSNIAGTRIGLFANLEASFASEKLQDYFYEVDEQYVTATRPAFDAKGGYLESNLFVGVGFKPLKQVNAFAGVAQGFFSGAENEDSPLFEVTRQTRFVLGLVWTIKTSKDMVDVVDMAGQD